MTLKPIYLCGFMGVGKSTAGRLLAEKLGLVFYDIDQKVMKSAGKTISEIFADDGESKFRELETKAIAFIADLGPSVVALGGGALNAPANQKRIKENGILIYLSASLKTLTTRLQSTSESRPLLAGLSDAARAERITTMLQTREAIYKTADFQISTDGRDAAAVAQDILQELRRRLS